MKTCIVDVLPHEPDYEFIRGKSQPAVRWDTPDGHWVGLYRNEIPDELGGEILKRTDAFSYEVWQPDYRADRVYTHRFEDGLIHRLFPAQRVKEFYGFKYRSQIHSPRLVQHLREQVEKHRTIVTINGCFTYLNRQVVAQCSDTPVLQTYRGTMFLPSTRIFKWRYNFLASLTYLREHQRIKKLYPCIGYLTHQNDVHLDKLTKLYHGPKTKITSGCDFSFWRRLDQATCRQALGLPPDRPVFFLSSLLKPMKQVDQVIKLFCELNERYDFTLVLSGHGSQAYEGYLRTLAQPLIEKGKVKFVGFITGDLLRQYYSSADLFINTSVSEGGPVSSMKAIACEVPVFTTDIGNVAERMRANRSGVLVGIRAYDQWKRALIRVLEGQPVKRFNRAEAHAYYDWQEIAAKQVAIYQYLDQQRETVPRSPKPYPGVLKAEGAD